MKSRGLGFFQGLGLIGLRVGGLGLGRLGRLGRLGLKTPEQLESLETTVTPDCTEHVASLRDAYPQAVPISRTCRIQVPVLR